MADYTVLTNLKVTGDMKAEGGVGITKSTYKTDSTKTLPTPGASYAKTDIEAICAAITDLRTKYDNLVTKLAEGTDPS